MACQSAKNKFTTAPIYWVAANFNLFRKSNELKKI